jgi:hypothetical protein
MSVIFKSEGRENVFTRSVIASIAADFAAFVDRVRVAIRPIELTC